MLAEVDATVVFFAVALFAEAAQAGQEAQAFASKQLFGLELVAISEASQNVGFCGGRETRFEATAFLLDGKLPTGALFGGAEILAQAHPQDVLLRTKMALAVAEVGDVLLAA